MSWTAVPGRRARTPPGLHALWGRSERDGAPRLPEATPTRARAGPRRRAGRRWPRARVPRRGQGRTAPVRLRPRLPGRGRKCGGSAAGVTGRCPRLPSSLLPCLFKLEASAFSKSSRLSWGGQCLAHSGWEALPGTGLSIRGAAGRDLRLPRSSLWGGWEARPVSAARGRGTGRSRGSGQPPGSARVERSSWLCLWN